MQGVSVLKQTLGEEMNLLGRQKSTCEFRPSFSPLKCSFFIMR